MRAYNVAHTVITSKQKSKLSYAGCWVKNVHILHVSANSCLQFYILHQISHTQFFSQYFSKQAGSNQVQRFPPLPFFPQTSLSKCLECLRGMS